MKWDFRPCIKVPDCEPEGYGNALYLSAVNLPLQSHSNFNPYYLISALY